MNEMSKWKEPAKNQMNFGNRFVSMSVAEVPARSPSTLLRAGFDSNESVSAQD
jgi:hypothetical protein